MTKHLIGLANARVARRLVVTLVLILLPSVAVASAATTIDIRGTYQAASGSDASGTYDVQQEDCQAGTFSGYLRGAGPFEGTITGDQIAYQDHYEGSSYSSTQQLTVSSDHTHLVGTFSDSNGSHGSSNLERITPAPSDPPPGCDAPPTGSADRTSALGVQCDDMDPNGAHRFRCAATAGDSSSQATPKTPTGTVTFTLDPDAGGTFPSGATCTLAPSSSGPTGFCSVEYQPGVAGVPIGTQPKLSATYGGDANFKTSTARPQNRFGGPPPPDPSPDPTTLTPQGPQPLAPDPLPDLSDLGCATTRRAVIRAPNRCPRGRDPRDRIGRVYEVQGNAYIQHADGTVERATNNSSLFVGDTVLTDTSSVAAAELAIGGRVGIKAGSGALFISEGEVRQRDGSPIILNPGGVWEKFTKTKDPLTIETRGGVMGIKG